MTASLAEKLVARAAHRAQVKPGEIVTCEVDLAMVHDSSGPRRLKPMLEQLDARIRDPERLVVITDHYLPALDDESRAILEIAREWTRSEGVRHFHDAEGICHVVLPEQGYLRPGMFVVGGDSHSPTGGAFGCYMFGVGATEMLGVVVTGEIWLRVPETIRIRWNGQLAHGVTAKDMMLQLCARLGLDGGRYQAVEFCGPAVTALDMQERMTLCNMAAEIGAQAGLIAPDAVTREFLLRHGVEADAIELGQWQSDTGAIAAEGHVFDAAGLAPQIALPHSPANAIPVTEAPVTRFDVAYLGACTGAKLTDLRMAAQILRGRRIAPGVQLLVGAASAMDERAAAADGTLQTLVEAGAQLLPNSCGACAGYGAYRFNGSEHVIASTARNFKGRMGSPDAQIYLGSPFSVAAAAVTGRLTDPRDLLAR